MRLGLEGRPGRVVLLGSLTRRLGPRTAACLLVACLALPPLAQAQPGVFVDPESPAAKEYAIPLDDARRQGEGKDRRARGEGSTEEPQLFGEGIEPPASGDSVAEGSRAGGGTSGASPPSGRDNSSGKAEGQASEAGEGSQRGGRSVAVEAAARGGSDALVTAAIAGLVLAGGLAVGFGLRRFLRSE
jgi:hypothetical protein